MDYYFVGYVNKDKMHTITDEQARILTHLNVAFAPMVGDITVMVLEDAQISELKRIQLANPNLAVLVSTGGGNNHGHGEATKTEIGMTKLVASTMDIVKRYNLAGIDCDWEFPGDTGILKEKYQHTALFAAYRKALDTLGSTNGKKYWLTTAAGSGQWYLDRTEIHMSHQYLDFINLMTYDSNTGGKQIGHHTNLYEPVGKDIPAHSADHHIRLMVNAGVPIEKILMGAAFYSQQWNQVPDIDHGYRQVSPDLNNWGPGYTDIVEQYENKEGYVKYFDEAAKAPYLFNGSTFFSYDDQTSVKYKCDYVKTHHMAGIFYWVHDADRKGELFEVIAKNIRSI
ncbi:MAG: glycosyl hydrolase family 18 protein [Niameybacter sp.]